MTESTKTPLQAVMAEMETTEAMLLEHERRAARIVREARQDLNRASGYHLIRHQLEGAELGQALIDRRLVPEGPTFTLAEMQEAVGGYVTIAVLYQGGLGRQRLPSCPQGRGTPEELVLLVDEDGIHKGLPVNLRASMIAGQTILGDALLCPRAALGGGS